jgi:hypothetical protein
MSIAVTIFVVVFYRSYEKQDTLKMQTLNVKRENLLEFNFTSDLLPFHHFTEFVGYEITNRYECLVKKEPEPCANMCDMLRIY